MHRRFFLSGNFREQLGTVKVDFIAANLSRFIELDRTYYLYFADFCFPAS
jgi:hypothetical protein